MTAEDRHMLSVMLTCGDVCASVAFYRDVLGFELKETWPSESEPQWANLVLHGQSVMVGVAMDPDAVDRACAGDAAALKYWKQAAADFRAHPAGVGVAIYLTVPDVDAYLGEIRGRGAQVEGEPKTQFYGIRDFGLDDPQGYRLIFATPVALSECQSCGMPLAEAQPGQIYCGYCTDERGVLRPYEQVFEGTVSGYFMGMQKMRRAEAEAAAAEHLSKMPAWAGRG